MKAVGEECERRLKELGITDSILLTVGSLIGKTHDFAKYSLFFQEHLKTGKQYGRELGSHAPLSALYAAWTVNLLINDPFFTVVAMLCVLSHHGDVRGTLDSLSDKLDKILGNNNYRKQLESIMRCADQILVDLRKLSLPDLTGFKQGFDRGLPELKKSLIAAQYRDYVNYLTKLYELLLLFSVLIDSDKKVAAGLEMDGRIEIDPGIVERYIKSRLENRHGRMADLRKIIYDNAMISLSELLRRAELPRIMTITAPTGAGKTLLGLSVAIKLRAEIQKRTGLLPRVIYVLPYINIIEQTHQVFYDVLFREYGEVPIGLLLKHHHLYAPIGGMSEDSPLDELLLLVESWDSEIIVTTFVQLFETLLGTRNSMLKKFHKLYNSIIIIDEAQTLPVEYWRLMREALSNLVKISNSYIIFMTATQPLIFRDAEELVKNSKDYFRKLERTVYNYIPERMHVEEVADFILEKWDKNVSMLAVVNTIATSIKLYAAIKKRFGGKDVIFMGADEEGLDDANKPVLCYLSTNIIPKERLRRISVLKKLLDCRKQVLVISTQLVEAGVDLDFDKTVRDIGPIDSVIQIGGRCNREWRKEKGEVYVIHVVDEEGRPDSVRIYGNLTIKHIAEPLLSKWKNFNESDIVTLLDEYYKLVSEKLQVDTRDESLRVLEAIKSFDFDKLSQFRLIREEPKTSVFVEIDQEARCVLEEFIRLWSKRRENVIDTYELRARLRLQRTKLEEYIIDTWETEGLPPVRVAEDVEIRYIPLSEVDVYYDRETGLRRSSELQASFW
ncbi:MAG: CRISPR-associated helicase Cas3' [Candidatus Korarchaeota archaeon]|nr:CRISPR-associated helicase Cas3' [Thermoproteota archaeon]